MEHTPLYKAVPRALKRFNYSYNLPRTLLSSILVWLGLRRSKNTKPYTAITFSISEDYARMWLHFARKNLDTEKWQFIIVDCAGDMRRSKLRGANVIKYLNLPHGKKIDMFLRKVINTDVVFLCDDDRYIVRDVAQAIPQLQQDRTALVSLAPRTWYSIKINGTVHKPMGSYALLMKRSLILKNNLSFMSSKQPFTARVVPEGSKKQPGYDTADHINEFFLKNDYAINTNDFTNYLNGFDGLSTPRISLMYLGKDYTKKALQNVTHYKHGSTNGSQLEGIYGVTQFEKLFVSVFDEAPRFVCDFTQKELRDIVAHNPHIDDQTRQSKYKRFETLEATRAQLLIKD